MAYKRSMFNVEIEELSDGRKLVYNTYSGIFGIMDKETQVIYNTIENLDVSSLDSDKMANVDIMHKSGYIVNTSKDELAALKLERGRMRHPDDRLHLTIAPTMDCNMRCPYCFETRRDLVMSDEIQEQLITFIKVHFDAYPKIKNLSVTWYGGEPLMQKEAIYHLSEKIIELCAEKEIKYSAGMITNGALLDAKTAKHLVDDCKVSYVQITIDGMKETHNKRRILANGEDSWDIITKNIEACKDFLQISIRINIDKTNADEIKEFARYFLGEKGWTDNPSFYLAPIEEYSEECLVSKSKCLEGGQFADINNEFMKATYAANRNAVTRQFFPRRKVIFCSGEGMLHYVVDPEGYLSNCYVTVGVEENRTGHISQPFVITSEYAKWMLTGIPEQCEKCEYLPMCMGGCGLHRVAGDGEPKCFKTFYTYKDILKLAYEDYIIQKSKKEMVTTT